MIQIDLEKAFDRVPHEILFLLLDYVNVGKVIRDTVRMAYTGCKTRLIINKVLGKRINVRRSVRQGCPLSSLLFSIYIESFCQKVMKSSNIVGYKLQEAEVRVLAYADDIAVFCKDYDSIAETIKIVNLYCNASGSLVNWSKCLGYWHGEWPVTPQFVAGISWTTTPVRYLGVPLEYYCDSEPYWRRQAVELREKAEQLNGFQLSIFARATFCNVFLVSKLWYVLQVMHCSRVNLQKLHRIFAVFLWGSSWERTSRTNLFRRVRSGGLGLCHLYLRQLVNRFMFFRNNRDPFIRTVIQLRLGRRLPEFVVASVHMKASVRGFLKEVVDSCLFLKTRFSLEYLSTVSRKKLYKDLVETVLPVPLYRALYRVGPGQNVLSRVKKMEVTPGAKSFFFKLHTGTLPVKTWMQEKGLFVPWGVDCLLCKKPETIEHVFLDCWDAVFFWDVLQRTLKKDLPLDAYGIRFLPVSNEEGIPFDLVMLLGLHGIWQSRMAVRHADVNARPVRQYFFQSVCSFVEAQKVQQEVPEWLHQVESLLQMKEF